MQRMYVWFMWVYLCFVFQIEKQLNVKIFYEWISFFNMMEREVEVYIFRFKLEIKYELNFFLKFFGMIDIFNQIKVDFFGILLVKGLYLLKVIYKSYVDVNEEGIEVVVVIGDSFIVKRFFIRVKFVVNYFFLFFIRYI